MTSSLVTALPPPLEVLGTASWRSRGGGQGGGRGFLPQQASIPWLGAGHGKALRFPGVCRAGSRLGAGRRADLPDCRPMWVHSVGLCPPCLAWLTPPCPFGIPVPGGLLQEARPLCFSVTAPVTLQQNLCFSPGHFRPVHCAAWNGLGSPQTQAPPTSPSCPRMSILQDGD